MKLRLLISTAFACLLFAGRASAQDLWQVRNSGVTVPLWSVAYGAGQWVAVGEQGTILTSPDGSTWTPRPSGFPTRWLVGVGYGTPNGNGLWVAVGESGLILTSPDAITWTARRAAGTRINAVAYGNGTFVAADDIGATYNSLDGITWSGPAFGARNGFVRGLVYGAPHFVSTGLSNIVTTYEGTISVGRTAAPQLQAAAFGRRLYLATGGANTFTSRDAITWTQQPATTTVGVQGATFFNNQFVAVGNAGGITTSFDGSAWSDRTSGTTQILLAVAGSPDSAIAVGFAGTILQSAATPSAPTVTITPASTYEAVGGNIAFTATAAGSAPFLYQWRKDGVDLPGATSETFFLPNVQLTHSGTYSCAVTNPLGFTVSAPAQLTVVSAFPPADPVDLTFTLGATLNTPPRSAAVQPDGKIIIGGSFLLLNEGQAQFGLARLMPSGALDTTFKPGAIDPTGVVQTIVVQPDGKILIGGNFATINGAARNRIARLNADGSLDLTFVPAYTPVIAVTQLKLLADGRILVVNNTSTLRCLSSDGSADPAWINPSVGFNVGGNQFNTASIDAVDVQLDGKIIGAFRAPPAGSIGLSGFLRRLNSNGSEDPSFPAAALNETTSDNIVTISSLRVLADGTISVAAALSPSRGGFINLVVRRFSVGGTLDRSFTLTDIRSNTGTTAVNSYLTADGRVWLSGLFTSVNGVTRSQLARLNADGTLDSAFSPGTGLLTPSGNTTSATFILPLDDGRAIAGGDFNRINSTVRPHLARLNAQSPGAANAPVILPLDTYYREIRAGEPFTVQVNAVGSTQLTYVASHSNGSSTSTALSAVPFSSGNNVSPGAYSVSAGNSAGATATQIFYVRVIPSSPFIISQPAAVQTNSGRPVSLSVTSGGSSLTYQWFKNGIALPNGLSATFAFNSANPADSGDYTVVIRNNLGFATSQTVHLGVDETPRFVNIATRALAGRADAPLIAGFVVAGPGSKRVMLRAVGPTLGSAFGVPGVLADPVLSVYNAAGTLIYTNDDWPTSNDMPGIASAGVRLGAFTLDGNSADAAGILTLAPGSYTAVVSSKNNATGVAMIEIYEDDNLSSRLINLSSRAYVGTGANVAIPGIVVRGGSATKKLLIRAVGPGLTPFGVPAVLADPAITLTDSNGATVATNDNWETATNLADLTAATSRVTFPLAAGSKDSALLVSVPSGGYTVQVTGVAGATGGVMVEVYELP